MSLLVRVVSERPFARVYYIDLQRDYPAIWDDEGALGTWLHLLCLAEQTWPLRPKVPRSVKPRQLRKLTEAGLVEVTDGRTSPKGWESERTERMDRARSSVAVRWNNERNTRASSSYSSSEVAPEESGTSLPAREDDRPDIEAFILARHRIPTPAQRKLMDDYLKVFDATGPQRAAQLILHHPDNPIGALKDDLGAFRKERLDSVATAENRPRPVRRNALAEESQAATLDRLYGAET